MNPFTIITEQKVNVNATVKCKFEFTFLLRYHLAFLLPNNSSNLALFLGVSQ